MAREQHSVRQKSSFDEWSPEVVAAAIKVTAPLVSPTYNDEESKLAAARTIGKLTKELLDELGRGR